MDVQTSQFIHGRNLFCTVAKMLEHGFSASLISGLKQTELEGAFTTAWKLFVGGVSWDTSSNEIKDYFSKFGEVSDVNIKTDPATGKSRGFAFVTFSAVEPVESVLAVSSHVIKGKQVDPKRAKAKPGVKKIFVGGLDPAMPEADIKAHFEQYGKVENVELPFDKVKNQRRQFCFITFESEDAVNEVCKQPKQTVGSKECDVKKATMKPDPRAMRGSFMGGGWGAPRGRGNGRGRGRGTFQQQGWGNQSYGGYGQGYGGYNQGYGNYDYSGYGSYGGGYGSNYSGYDYSGWGYGQGYGQQNSSYGKVRRGNSVGYHPYR
ncbi:heterogeneous nuclear ribonucleoprotein D-like isoform X2 [Tachypleus tridentatus]|uniref:heterogeneous nuclear ribonucleoprotein D-like isoform X2 n=1 Tax=Tachypleus tridentatus TaxID=6853 RepID=UPI003FD0592B